MTKATKSFLTFIILFLLLTGVSLLLLNVNFEVVPIKGVSMTPTVLDGDKVFIRKTKKVERGEVVVFYNPIKESDHPKLIKRVIGLPGDVIETALAEDGTYRFYVNGEALSEEYTNGENKYQQNKVTVPEGKFYYLGDNRAESADSRLGNWGAISDIIGKVLFRFNTADGLTISAVK